MTWEMALPSAALIIAVGTLVLGYFAVNQRVKSRDLEDLKENEFKHVNERLARLEQKLDEHIIWHLENKK